MLRFQLRLIWGKLWNSQHKIQGRHAGYETLATLFSFIRRLIENLNGRHTSWWIKYSWCIEIFDCLFFLSCLERWCIINEVDSRSIIFECQYLIEFGKCILQSIRLPWAVVENVTDCLWNFCLPTQVRLASEKPLSSLSLWRPNIWTLTTLL